MFEKSVEACPANPFGSIEAHEFLVVLNKPGVPKTPWVQDLEKTAIPVNTVNFHYFEIKSGSGEPAGQKPWASVAWQRGDKYSLERRWLANRLSTWFKERAQQKSLVFWVPADVDPEQLVVLEDILMMNMTARYQSSKLEAVRILSPNPARITEIDPARPHRLASHLGFRQWLNENPDELTSIEIGRRLENFAKGNDCGFKTLDVEELRRNKMNLLLSVGQASELSPPRLHIVTKQAKGDDRPPLLLIGKGITFDTGGINLKPHESFVNCMKNDMGGAGLMSAVFMALVKSGFDYPLVLAIPTCENLVGERAMKPGAIIESASGKTVIIEHTDAEGRLILADTITYCEKHYRPNQSIIAATLTTASMRQFSNYITAVHFADQVFEKGMVDAANAWGERFTFWDDFLPFRDGNTTNAADLTNMGRLPNAANGAAGSNVAAHFLREFATAPLIHFDIFASTWNWSGQYPGAHYGATGAPFNSLFGFLRAKGSAWMAAKS